MKQFALMYLLCLAMLTGLAMFTPTQEAPKDGSLCARTAGVARGVTVHACACRLMCDPDSNGEPIYGEEGGPEDSPTRCKRWCVKGACGCHPEPTPKDCAGHAHVDLR